MSAMGIESLLELLEDDREILDALIDLGIVASGTESFSPEEVEMTLVTRTLVRELEVNWAGVEVILQMRRQLLLTRTRLSRLVAETKGDSIKGP